MLFKYSEPKWYSFGLKVGFRNLLKNGTKLGLKKALGKIFQPINSYTRFPEFHFFGSAIEHFIVGQRGRQRLRILDVGSPKLVGLYLAYHYDVDIYLTDINRLNIDEYIVLWDSIKDRSRGIVVFDRQDGRSLSYPKSQFDVVYAMSVLEHVEGDGQDSRSASELWRVLKPGGLLLLSVPFGNLYVEQSIVGRAHAVENRRDEKLYFFQRVYDPLAVQAHLLMPLSPSPERLQVWTVFRRKGVMTQAYHRLREGMGENINGFLGFLNPIWSLLLNRRWEGLHTEFYTSYTSIHSLRDIYGDLVIVCRKPCISHELKEGSGFSQR